MKYKRIIWDIDGVLLRTDKGVIDAVNYILIAHNHPVLTSKQTEKLLATSRIQDALRDIFNTSDDDALVLANEYRAIYQERFLYEAELYPHILDILKSFYEMGCMQAITTNKHRKYAPLICHHFGLDQYCNPIIGHDGQNQTTKSQLLYQCLEIIGSRDAVMIGDTVGDKEAAAAMKIDFIGVNYGYGFHDVPGYANSPKEILSLLND